MIENVILAGLGFVTAGLFIAAAFAFKMEREEKQRQTRVRFQAGAAHRTWQKRMRHARPMPQETNDRIFMYLIIDRASKELGRLEAL